MQLLDVKKQWRIAVLVIVAIAIAVFLTLSLTHWRFERRYPIYVDFKFSGMVTTGAAVKISNVVVGYVDKIEFIGHMPTSGERLATRLHLSIYQSMGNAITEGSQFFIGTSGVIGEQFVEVVPSETWSTPIQAKTIHRGIDAPRPELLLARMSRILDRVALLMEDHTQDFEQFFKTMNSLMKTLDQILQKREHRIGQGIDHLMSASEELHALVKKINRGIGSEQDLKHMVQQIGSVIALLQKKAPPITQDAQVLLKDGRQLLSLLNEIASQDKDKIHQTITNLSQTTKDAQSLVKQIKQGEGTLGGLLKDEEIYADLKDFIQDLKQHPWKLIWRN